MEIGFAIYLWLINIPFCVWLAAQKKRNTVSWSYLAFFFGPVASLFLMAAPQK